MSGIGDRAAALVTGCGGLVFSVVYILSARSIEDSLLADPVGASGVPVAIGGLMALASAALIVKGLVPAGRTVSGATAAADTAEEVQHPRVRLDPVVLGLRFRAAHEGVRAVAQHSHVEFYRNRLAAVVFNNKEFKAIYKGNDKRGLGLHSKRKMGSTQRLRTGFWGEVRTDFRCLIWG